MSDTVKLSRNMVMRPPVIEESRFWLREYFLAFRRNKKGLFSIRVLSPVVGFHFYGYNSTDVIRLTLERIYPITWNNKAVPKNQLLIFDISRVDSKKTLLCLIDKFSILPYRTSKSFCFKWNACFVCFYYDGSWGGIIFGKRKVDVIRIYNCATSAHAYLCFLRLCEKNRERMEKGNFDRIDGFDFENLPEVKLGNLIIFDVEKL